MKVIPFAVILFLTLSLWPLSSQAAYEIKINGNKKFSAELLKREILFLKFRDAGKNELQKAADLLQEFYEDRGFLLAEVTYTIIEKNDTLKLPLAVFNIQENDQFYFGEIDIKGLNYNKPAFVRSLINLEAGQPLSRNLIVKYQKELNNSALFDSAKFLIKDFDWEKARVNLVLWVYERKPFFVGSGIGLDSEDGLKYIAEGGRRHLWGRGEQARLEGAISYYYTNSVFLKHVHLSGSYFDPLFIWRRLQWMGKVGYESDKPTYVVFSFGKFSAESNFRILLMENLSAQVGGSFDKVQLYKYSGEYIHDKRIRDRIDQNRQLRFGLSYNSTYPQFDPMIGHKWELNYQYTGGLLGGNNDFNRFTGTFSIFLPINSRNVLALHSRAGWMERFGETVSIPSYQRFFLGGSRNLRGYRNNHIGPQNENGRYTGGLVLVYHAVEWRHLLSRRWQLIGFIDSGLLTNKIAELKVENFVITAGPGFRYRWRGSLFALDLGVKVSDFYWKEPGWVHFGYGQHF
ncbi:MAG: BamA/TamA family outer membrane protein [Calditrichia bacterium]